MYKYQLVKKMSVITITIPDEIKRRLEEINNKSKLIAELLSEYFNKEEGLQILKAKKEQIEKEHKEMIASINEKIKREEEEERKKEVIKAKQDYIRKAREEAMNDEIITIS